MVKHRIFSLWCVVLLLTACTSTDHVAPVYDVYQQPGSKAMPTHYTVERGDTLYSVAWHYGLDYQDLARWNQLGDNYHLRVGQRLQLRSPSPQAPAVVAKPVPVAAAAKPAVVTSKPAQAPSKPAAQVSNKPLPPVSRWTWPSQGTLVGTYGQNRNKGVNIAGKLGQPVRAAAAGEVVYSGTGLPGYGKLIIIKHDAKYLSAYAHNDRLLVKEGDRVKLGAHIADMGSSGATRVMLHFEIRVNGKPVNPLTVLPKR